MAVLFAEGGALEGVSQKWGEALNAIGGIPIVGPFLKAFAPALIGGVVAIGKKAWGALKRMFGEGLNAAEEAYQGIADAAMKAAEADVALNQRMTAALAAGLDERAAAVRAFLIHVRTEQGCDVGRGRRRVPAVPRGAGGLRECVREGVGRINGAATRRGIRRPGHAGRDRRAGRRQPRSRRARYGLCVD